MLTEEQREAIRERAANTPDGPWTWDKGTKDCSAGVLNEDGVIACVTYHPSRVLEDATAEFIAASRTDIPGLLITCDELEQQLADVQRERDEAHQVIDESHRMIVDEDTGRRWKELYVEVQGRIPKLEQHHRVGAEAIRELFGIADIVNSFPEAPRSDGKDGALGRRVKGLVDELKQQLTTLQEENKRLREELRFYSDTANHQRPLQHTREITAVALDGGQRARRALGKG